MNMLQTPLIRRIPVNLPQGPLVQPPLNLEMASRQDHRLPGYPQTLDSVGVQKP